MSLIYWIVFIVSVIIFCYYENNIIKITKIRLDKNLNESLKIVHISDIHSKIFGRNNRVLINKILRLNPDLILGTGDLIDTNGENLDEIIKLLDVLNTKSPVYYILGNHENRIKNQDVFVERLRKSRAKLLINETKSITIRNTKISILGLNEQQGSFENYVERRLKKYIYKDYSELFDKLEKDSTLKFVLSHYPENFSLIGDKSYENYDFDIMFSGHAHGGQFILPLIGGLYAPSQGVFPKYYSGLYGKETKLIVSRGLGPSRFPLRLFNRPEIILLEIN